MSIRSPRRRAPQSIRISVPPHAGLSSPICRNLESSCQPVRVTVEFTGCPCPSHCSSTGRSRSDHPDDLLELTLEAPPIEVPYRESQREVSFRLSTSAAKGFIPDPGRPPCTPRHRPISARVHAISASVRTTHQAISNRFDPVRNADTGAPHLPAQGASWTSRNWATTAHTQ